MNDRDDDSLHSKKSGKLKLCLLLLLCCCCVAAVCIGVSYAASNKRKPNCIQPTLYLNLSNKKAAQSTTTKIGTNQFNVNFAQDSDNTTCSHTDGDDKHDYYPWWRLDLEVPYVITNVTFIGREGWNDRNENLQLRVGNYLEKEIGIVFNENGVCDEYPGANSNLIQFDFVCPPMLFGRYITLQKTKSSKSALIYIR
uniref:Fucolectin tachylectin-4 pentraxin-1 domain-containing protein n=1 Tax=Strigamia maritima TaxID=126957 RepID=T1J6I3_STRMM